MFAISFLHHDVPNTGIVIPTQAASPAQPWISKFVLIFVKLSTKVNFLDEKVKKTICF